MKIGLMGCEFVSPNKGCEALSYSALNIFNKINLKAEKIEIYNFSGTELGDVVKEFPNFKFINVKPKLKDLKFKYIRALKKCDIIFDATMGDSFSDIYSKDYYEYLMKHKKIAEMFNKNYVLLPQTYGPFYNNSSIKLAKKVFDKAKKIYCRDQLSKEVLKKDFNINNTELVTDMAFLLPYFKERFSFDSNKKKIGVNVSGLLYKGGFNYDNQFDLSLDYKEYINKIIECLTNCDEYEIYLIPHVIDLSLDSHDDDYKVCEELNKKFPKTILAPAFNNPIDAKSYISNMDIFIGSRMHSTIAAFSSNVATIPVSYSRKFEGLFDSLDYQYVINGKKESTESALEKTLNYIKIENELKTQQEKSKKIIDTKNKLLLESIKELMKK